MHNTKTRRARRREGWILSGSLLNVDLDVYSRDPLDVLADALGRKVSVNYAGREGRDYSLHCSLLMLPIPSLDSALRAWTKLITALPRTAKTAWKRAKRRELNVGLRSQLQSEVDEMRVNPPTLNQIARLGATIAVTLYPITIKRQSLPKKSGT
jgi:hypothetical protein